jgi:hypothetical protein
MPDERKPCFYERQVLKMLLEPQKGRQNNLSEMDIRKVNPMRFGAEISTIGT